jgi:hypothetical protein
MYAPRSRYHQSGKFGRMFPALAPFAEDTVTVRAALAALGDAGGPMDPDDDLSDAKTLIIDANKSLNNPDSANPRQTAGMTFLGQFIDHDITFDPTSSLERQVDPEAVSNFRTPLLELDSVYGSGPGASPHLYDQAVDDGATTLLVEEIEGAAAKSRLGAPRFDLPRNSKNRNTALLGDPRNDENLMVSQLHLAMLKLHNAFVAEVKAEGGGLSPSAIFAEAQKRTRWHYQWVVLHDFLPATIGGNKTRTILKDGLKCYRWATDPFIPVEFAVAAYRFGHSQVRPSYRANFGAAPGDEFFALIFDPTQDPNDADPNDLRGGRRAPRRFVDWQTFFDFGDGNVRRNKRIDTKLSSVLFNLLGTPAGGTASLATRNLLRHLTFGVPSGQAIARITGAPMLAEADLAEVADAGLRRNTPLWYYILKEAEVMRMGARLGPVGGRIVGEVFIGILLGDPMSFLNRDPNWKPAMAGGDPRMRDLLAFAGVTPPLS